MLQLFLTCFSWPLSAHSPQTHNEICAVKDFIVSNIWATYKDCVNIPNTCCRELKIMYSVTNAMAQTIPSRGNCQDIRDSSLVPSCKLLSPKGALDIYNNIDNSPDTERLTSPSHKERQIDLSYIEFRLYWPGRISWISDSQIGLLTINVRKSSKLCTKSPLSCKP